jgi:hypothetical protein
MADLADMNDGTVSLTSPSFAAATITGDLTVDTNTLHVDSTNNNVGIGTSSPASFGATANGLTINGTTNSNIVWQEGGSNKAFAYSNGNDFLIGSEQSGGNTILTAAGSERMRIDSSGNVGIGTSSPANKLEVSGAVVALGAATAYTNTGLYIQNKGSSVFDVGAWRSGASVAELTFSTDSGSDAAPTERMRIDSSGRVGIGTSSPSNNIAVYESSSGNAGIDIDNTQSGTALVIGKQGSTAYGATTAGNGAMYIYDADLSIMADGGASNTSSIKFSAGGNTERMRIDSSGHIQVGKTSGSFADVGVRLLNNGQVEATVAGSDVVNINRLNNDGTLVRFFQNTIVEGSISVSGTTVSYNGGHLARWSQLTDGAKDETIVKGTVMTNLDQMAVWSHDAVEAQNAVYDEDGNVVTEAVEAKDAYTEDNEQLNCMAVSSVEGDANVAGVFVNWDSDDDEFNDMNIAMTGDMVIRIAQGTTVARGDLLMSAGDGTAKPQGDDIVRSKTIAKVTSTNVSHTYDDGSYLVPCVLMAC